ncbi:class B sortase [Paenibacillus sanguinis]|uniref:class B sortase n=1 Tax=Paenibacillus sanguinis TaxID=225906 RepID=UPI0003730871|nr:class B sortase [Paenibacillus sanguinis]
MEDKDTRQGTGNTGIRRLLRVLIGLSLLGAVISAYTLISANREYAAGDESYEQLRREIKLTSAADESASLAKAAESSDGRTMKLIDFEQLRLVNPDVTAWITAEESVIDYPVVQGADNEYYLNHLFTRAPNKLGSLFVDYRTPGDFTARNTIIYGHNMKDGSMFSSLTKYKDQEYFETHPTMKLYTPDGAYTIELFAGIVADGDYEFIRYQFTDNEDFMSYTAALREESTFQAEVEIEANDRIVALCTCSYEFNNARYALFGKLVPIK